MYNCLFFYSLVEAANSLVQGHATEEKLISAAKQVASSTAQLLVACKVKSAPDSDATRRLNVSYYYNMCKEYLFPAKIV